MVSSWILNNSILPLGITTQGHSGPECNGNGGVLRLPQSPKFGTSPLVSVYCHTQDTR